LDEVQKHLGELNTYSDQTIYNFSEMAKNIGTFTAAGVGMDESTASIKGIANLAALSGSNSLQASTAMYQLSQAIASGKVGLQDWNSVVNAGMGGAVFQKSLMRTAENMGALEKGAVKIDKATGKATINGESFRESIWSLVRTG
jgi:tape measure domain-containing protein